MVLFELSSNVRTRYQYILYKLTVLVEFVIFEAFRIRDQRIYFISEILVICEPQGNELFFSSSQQRFENDQKS